MFAPFKNKTKKYSGGKIGGTLVPDFSSFPPLLVKISGGEILRGCHISWDHSV